MNKTISKRITEQPQDWVQIVREKVEGLVLGEVLITVHEHRVTQIERRERVQFPLPKQDK
jgi:hypothetical protein